MSGFNDPGTWGYCEYCAFMVSRDPVTGTLLPHPKGRHREGDCNGSWRKDVPVPEVATPRDFTSLTKSAAQIQKRAEWVKAREEALRKIKEGFNVGPTANMEE